MNNVTKEKLLEMLCMNFGDGGERRGLRPEEADAIVRLVCKMSETNLDTGIRLLNEVNFVNRHDVPF